MPASDTSYQLSHWAHSQWNGCGVPTLYCHWPQLSTLKCQQDSIAVVNVTCDDSIQVWQRPAKQSRWKDPPPRPLPVSPGSGASWGRRGLMLRTKQMFQFFNVFNRPHKTKSWLRHWILFINTHSAVSQIQSVRQILPLSVDIPMLKSCQLQWALPPWPAEQGLWPGPHWGSTLRPQLYIKHGGLTVLFGWGLPTL